ncbi:MAG: hypothetical protein ACLGH4_08415 [Actinomycetes bacterium]
MRKLIALAALPAVLSLTLAAPATAARPTPATLTVSTAGASATSSEPTVGSSLVFSGCGYEPGRGVSVTVTSPTAIAFFGGMAGDDGCFSTASKTIYTADNPGTYKAAAYQSSRRKADASVIFTVSS